MPMLTKYIKTVGLVLTLLALHATVAYACPGCKQALDTAEGEQANMVNGYFWSILFMLAMPFTLIGLFSGSMYLAVRKARRDADRSEGVGVRVNGRVGELHTHA